MLQPLIEAAALITRLITEVILQGAQILATAVHVQIAHLADLELTLLDRRVLTIVVTALTLLQEVAEVTLLEDLVAALEVTEEGNSLIKLSLYEKNIHYIS